MMNRPFIALVCIILLLPAYLKAQESSLDLVNYSGSTSTLGMGEQGVALRNGQDAFTFNPANLSFNNSLKLSFFRNPFQTFVDFPLSNLTAAAKVKGVGTFGVQYLRHDYGEVWYSTAESPDGASHHYHFYEYALSLGYSRELSEALSVGLALKYGREEYGSSLEDFMFSFGLNYQPEFFKKRLNFGLSFMNLGAPIETNPTYYNGRQLASKTPAPAQMHLALDAVPFEDELLSFNLQLGISRYLRKYNPSQAEVKSSFSSLFDDWGDFPKDTKIHTGLAFEWKPLNLGQGFSFYQNFYLGSISPGPIRRASHCLTHGAEIILGYKDLSVSLGYAGEWHRVEQLDYHFLSPLMPYETFQFSVEWNINKYINHYSEPKSTLKLSNIMLQAGTGYSFRKGQLIPETMPEFYHADSRNSMSYFLEAAFYFDKKNALITSFSYTSIPISVSYPAYKYTFKTKYETVGFYSAYRYHPLEVYSPLYCQGGLGIIRINPVEKYSYPKYSYQTSFNGAIGSNLDLFGNGIVISPELDYQLMFVPLLQGTKAPRLGGENQLSVSLKLGYIF